jgi:hypothetical protein
VQDLGHVGLVLVVFHRTIGLSCKGAFGFAAFFAASLNGSSTSSGDLLTAGLAGVALAVAAGATLAVTAGALAVATGAALAITTPAALTVTTGAAFAVATGPASALGCPYRACTIIPMPIPSTAIDSAARISAGIIGEESLTTREGLAAAGAAVEGLAARTTSTTTAGLAGAASTTTTGRACNSVNPGPSTHARPTLVAGLSIGAVTASWASSFSPVSLVAAARSAGLIVTSPCGTGSVLPPSSTCPAVAS